MFVKRAALCIAVCIIIGSFPFFSLAEGAPLTPDELTAYADSVRAMAETDGFYNAEAADSGSEASDGGSEAANGGSAARSGSAPGLSKADGA